MWYAGNCSSTRQQVNYTQYRDQNEHKASLLFSHTCHHNHGCWRLMQSFQANLPAASCVSASAVWGKDLADIAFIGTPRTPDNKTPSVPCLQQLDWVAPYVPYLAGGERVSIILTHVHEALLWSTHTYIPKLSAAIKSKQTPWNCAPNSSFYCGLTPVKFLLLLQFNEYWH